MRRAFSLVELSIVLVILGLLTGGILAGQNLIRAAEMRGTLVEFQQYQTAVHTFRNKYFALPGDMRNATDFWGAADTSGTGGECGAPLTDVGTGTQTCNGNGDGRLAQDNPFAEAHERYRFWQHLANAGLIEGSYEGIQGSGGTNHAEVGLGAAKSKLGNAAWSASERDNSHDGESDVYRMDFGNVMFFGAQTAANVSADPVLTPEEAWSIDTKVDDGKPAYGRLLSGHVADCTTLTDNEDFNGEYNLTNPSIECDLLFKGPF